MVSKRNLFIVLFLFTAVIAQGASFFQKSGLVVQNTLNSSGGTVTLGATSNQVQIASGNSVFTYVLPDETLVSSGWWYEFWNQSTNQVRLADFNNNTVASMKAGEYARLVSASKLSQSGNWYITKLTPEGDIWAPALQGLGTDFLPQYLNLARGDSRYPLLTSFISTFNGLANQPLKTNSLGTLDSTFLPAGIGSGTVVGPTVATINSVAVFSTTDGSHQISSQVNIDGSGNILPNTKGQGIGNAGGSFDVYANKLTATGTITTAFGTGFARTNSSGVVSSSPLVGSDLPIPAATTLGGTKSFATQNNTFLTSINSLDGTPIGRTLTSGDIPSLSATYLPLTGGTMSGVINLGTNQITNMVDPTTAQMGATKAYVDAQLAQLNPAASVYAASTANIVGTYTNAVGGVCIGDTFTVTATGAFTVDGATPPAGSRILLKNQTSSFQNGVWVVTVAGSVGVSPVFTRALDYDSSADFNSGQIIPVVNGAQAGSSWFQTNTVTTCSSDAQSYTKFQNAASAYLLSANNLSDVGTKATAFNNLSPMTTGGDLIYGGASGAGTRLANGNNGQVLTSAGTTSPPTWTTIAAGGTATANAVVIGLALSNGGTTPSTQVNATANSVALVNTSGSPFYTTSVAVTVDLTTGTSTSTPNGMDGEARANSSWVYIYLISNGVTTAGLGTNTAPSSGSPTMPSGYTYKAYLGALRVDSSGNLLRTRQLGRDSHYVVVAATNTSVPPNIASASGSGSCTVPTWTSLATGAFVPATAGTILVSVFTNNAITCAAPNNAYGAATAVAGPPICLAGASIQQFAPAEFILESTNIFWCNSSGTSGAVNVLGWKDYYSAGL